MKSKLLVILLFSLLLFVQCENPVKPSFSIRISFVAQSNQEISLFIFSSSGRKMRTLLERERVAGGGHIVQWNGMNDKGEKVVEGIYYYRLEKWEDAILVETKIEKFVVN